MNEAHLRYRPTVRRLWPRAWAVERKRERGNSATLVAVEATWGTAMARAEREAHTLAAEGLLAEPACVGPKPDDFDADLVHLERALARVYGRESAA